MTEIMSNCALAGMPLPMATVQNEWNRTLARMRAACHVEYATELVDMRRYPTIDVSHTPDLDAARLEAILFENLLLAPLHRLEYARTISFQCEWLWAWRRAVPWKLERAGSMYRLAPSTPRSLWCYRYHILETGS